MPSFAERDVPSQAEWQDVANWLLKKLIDHALTHDDSILTGLAGQ